jgi:hypothetical protein
MASSGGPPVELYSGPANRLAIAGDTLYFTTWYGNAVMSVAKAGGPATTLAVVANNTNSIAIHGGTIYFGGTGGTLGTLYSMPVAGGPVTVLRDGHGLFGIAVDSTGVYFTTFDEGEIMRMAHDGSGLAVLADGEHSPREIAVDDTAVYWTNDDGTGDNHVGAVMKTSK